MTRGFLNDDFLLDTATARALYHGTAKGLPIIDYHNHLSPHDILSDRKWDNLGQIWLEGDHYKWRAMRWNGVAEHLITGAASDREKYDAFAATIPMCLGNPLYHWTHLELCRYFDQPALLSPQTAPEIWEAANDRLSAPGFGARGLLRQMKVEFVGTTDDPADPLDTHIALANDKTCDFKVAPSFRPDRAFKFHLPDYPGYIQRLGAAAKIDIRDFETLIEALLRRLQDFIAAGCMASDHGLDAIGTGKPATRQECNAMFNRAMAGQPVALADQLGFQTAVLIELGRAYHDAGIVAQFHIGAERNARTALYKRLGTDVGVDSISDAPISGPLNTLLDQIEAGGGLPRTILYALDPGKNEVIVTTAGNFQDGSVAGKIQAGTAWWFNDQLDGMERQIRQLTQMGLLAHFLGMLTDSRSFLSFPRHEYFRRLICRMIGRWAESGEMPDDPEILKPLVRRICYDNAKAWFLPDGKGAGRD